MVIKKLFSQYKDMSVVGWREWVKLPKLHVDHIKAKVDTGAKTSTLHAIGIERYRRNFQDRVKFYIHPIQKNDDIEVACSAEIVDIRTITDSGGKRERRFIIETPIIIGDKKYNIELTLTDRTNMSFRMLLGRAAVEDRFLVSPHSSYLQRKLIRE